MGVKISELDAAADLVGDESLPIVQGEATVRTTPLDIASLTPPLEVTANAGTSISLALADQATVIKTTSNSNVTITLGNSLPEGFTCAVIQGGTGQITFAAGSGASLHNRQGQTKSAGQWALCSLVVVSNPNDASASYVLGGDTA